MEFEPSNLDALNGLTDDEVEFYKQLALFSIQTAEEPLVNRLVEIVKKEHCAHNVAIVLEVGNEKNQLYANVVGLLSAMAYIYFRAMKSVRNKVITPQQYVELVETLYAIGFPKVDHFDFPRELRSQFVDAVNEFEEKQAQRKRAIEILSKESDGNALITSLGLDRELPNPANSPISLSDGNLFELLEDMIKFLSMPHNAKRNEEKYLVSYLGSIMVRVMDELKLLPKINSGFSIIKTLSKKKRETMEEYMDRVDAECKRISSEFSNSKDKIFASMVICPRSFGELAVNGILPEHMIDSTDTSPEARNLLESLRNQAESY